MAAEYDFQKAAGQELRSLLYEVEPEYREVAQKVFLSQIELYLKILPKISPEKKADAESAAIQIAKYKALITANTYGPSHVASLLQESQKRLNEFDREHPYRVDSKNPELYDKERGELRTVVIEYQERLKKMNSPERKAEINDIYAKLDHLNHKFIGDLPEDMGKEMSNTTKSLLAILTVASVSYLTFSNFKSAVGLASANPQSGIINTILGVILIGVFAVFMLKSAKK